jgi:hypothetical protein
VHLQDKIYLVLVLRYLPFQEQENLLFELCLASRQRVFTVMGKKKLEFNFFLKPYPMSKSSFYCNPTPAICGGDGSGDNLSSATQRLSSIKESNHYHPF